ncbi:MAG: hypothetical protein JWP25_6294 [Bradyrhizobium sp.]|nr:hypothetical protein [Bradyrhizobium sp.]
MRWIFRSAILVVLGVLAVDLANINGWIIYPDPAVTPAEIREDSPAPNLPRLLPSIFAPLFPDSGKRLVPLPQPEGALAKPMTFELVGGGRLMASGIITAGVSQGFAAEAERHGEYIRTVVLNSPGGSVADALAMGGSFAKNDSQLKSKQGNIVCHRVPWCLPVASIDALAKRPRLACIR